MARKKMTKAEREAFFEQMRLNAERTRKLAERGQAELDRKQQEQQHR
jgi:hypothetical protein